jgi:hypothetical protein
MIIRNQKSHRTDIDVYRTARDSEAPNSSAAVKVCARKAVDVPHHIDAGSRL